MKIKNRNHGFIGTIILIIAALVLLKVWFDFDVFKWLNTPKVKEFFTEFWNFLNYVWGKYLQAPVVAAVKFIVGLFMKH